MARWLWEGGGATGKATCTALCSCRGAGNKMMCMCAQEQQGNLFWQDGKLAVQELKGKGGLYARR